MGLSLEPFERRYHVVCDRWVLKLVTAVAQHAVPVRRLSFPCLHLFHPACGKLGAALSKCTCLQFVGLANADITERGWSNFILSLPRRDGLIIAGSWPDEHLSALRMLVADGVGPTLSD